MTRMPGVSATEVEAEPEAVGMSTDGLRGLSRLVQGYVEAGKVAGAVTAVLRRGKLVLFETHGQMDVAAAKPMRPDAIFRLYSMTKPVTSVALLSLYEEGRFQLDDPVSRYIPALARLRVFESGTPESYTTRAPARPVTVRDTLLHTTGISAGGRSTPGQLYERMQIGELRGDGRLKETWTLADMVEAVAGMPLEFEPGTRWVYGISTDIAARLCEVISGQPFDRFIHERILAPLGMCDTGYMVPAANVDRLTASYRRGGPGEPPLVLTDPAGAESRYARPKTFFSGAGGLVSTAPDYLRFCRMLAGGGAYDGVRILGPRTVQYMAMNHLPGGCDIAAVRHGWPVAISARGTGWGLGVAVLLDPTVAQVQGTPGEYYWDGAGGTSFFISPRDELAVLFMTQMRANGTYLFREELRAAVYGSLLD